MSDEIYSASDEQGYDYAFDAIGKIINWSSVARTAKKDSVKLTLSLAMLFTHQEDEEEEFNPAKNKSRATVTIPKGADKDTIQRLTYATVRAYIRRVSTKLGLPPGTTPPNTVALLSQVTMQ